METLLISGTNRGIGLELVRQYLSETPHAARQRRVSALEWPPPAVVSGT